MYYSLCKVVSICTMCVHVYLMCTEYLHDCSRTNLLLKDLLCGHESVCLCVHISVMSSEYLHDCSRTHLLLKGLLFG